MNPRGTTLWYELQKKKRKMVLNFLEDTIHSMGLFTYCVIVSGKISKLIIHLQEALTVFRDDFFEGRGLKT
jgi:hypothetical protein